MHVGVILNALFVTHIRRKRCPRSAVCCARRHAVPETLAPRFTGRIDTHAELDAEIDRVAHALARFGLARGDSFALMANNSDHFVSTLYAALRACAVVFPINPASAAPELLYLLSIPTPPCSRSTQELAETRRHGAGDWPARDDAGGSGGIYCDDAQVREQPEASDRQAISFMECKGCRRDRRRSDTE